jgi:hypothetical protein
MDLDDITPTPEDLGFEGVTSRFADLPGVVIDLERIPAEFRHLVEYARFWSVGDDTERSDLMWLTPHEELKAFVEAAWPLMQRIHEWCERYISAVPVSDEVTVFRMMLEAAAEAVAAHVDPEI